MHTECGFVLQYIVDHYDKLVDQSIFPHGNPHILKQVEWLLQLAHDELQKISFLHMNCQEYVERRDTKAETFLDLLGFNRDMFTSEGNLTSNEISSGMRYFASQCYAQFMVSSKTIQRYPLAFWQLALKITLDNKQFCIEWEYMWHAIFLSIQTLPKHLTLDYFYHQTHPNFISKCHNGI